MSLEIGYFHAHMLTSMHPIPPLNPNVLSVCHYENCMPWHFEYQSPFPENMQLMLVMNHFPHRVHPSCIYPFPVNHIPFETRRFVS